MRWFLVKGYVVKNFYHVMGIYFLPLPSLPSPLILFLLPSLVSVPLLQSTQRDIVKVTEQNNDTRQYKEACRDELNRTS